MFTTEEVIKATGGRLVKGENLEFAAVCTDTRKILKGALFVALQGENFNGEDFLRDAAEKGATGAIVSQNCREENLNANIAVVAAEDTLAAYQALARANRQKFAAPVIAVTGSNGKTTTKELTAAALSSKGKILKTEANFNNEIGLPLTLLQMTEEHKAAVVEMGMRGFGQIAALMKVAEPDIGIVTNVGEVHAELLGSVDNIAKAKGEMAENIKSGGTLILNADDERVAAMGERAKEGVKIITYGINKKADVRGGGIRADGLYTRFMAVANNERHDYKIPLLGKHNVYNALAAIAAALAAGLSTTQINEGFSSMQLPKMRFEIIKKDSITVINDAYNAAPASVKAALDTVAAMTAGLEMSIPPMTST